MNHRLVKLAAVVGVTFLAGCTDDHYSDNRGYYQHQGSVSNLAAFGFGAIAGHMLSNHHPYGGGYGYHPYYHRTVVVNHYHTHYHVHR